MANAEVERELGSFRAKFFLAVGSIGWGVKDAGITGPLLLFYSQVVGVPAALVGLAIGTALVFDAVIDPVIGIASDNFSSPWGRRLPFMYIAGLPVGLIYFFIWQPPHVSPFRQFLYLVTLTILARGFIALFEIPSTALVPELTSDYNKRTAFLNWRYFLGIMGAAFIGYASYRWLLVPDKLHPIGQLNPAGYPRYALLASVVMVLSILISCLGLHRYVPLFIKTPPRYAGISQFRHEIWQTVNLKTFRILIVSGLCGAAAAGLSGALAPTLLTYFWRLDNKQIALFSLAGLIGALLAFIVFVPLARLVEKKAGAIFASVVAIVVGTGPYVIALFGWQPDIAHHPSLLLFLLGLFVVLSAIGITALVLVGSMMADIVEMGAVETGRRTEGTFFAAMSLIAKASSGIGVLAAGLMLGFVGLQARALPSSVSPDVMHRLFLIYVPTLCLLYLGAIISFSRYRITRAQHEANLRTLAERFPSATVSVAQPPPPIAPSNEVQIRPAP